MVGVESERRGCNTCAVTMTREPVAIDLINLGGIAERVVGGLMRSSSIECDERVSRGRLLRPVPSMLNHPSRSQSVSRMSPGPDGLRDRNINYFTQPGPFRPPWMSNHVAAGRVLTDCRSHCNFGMAAETSAERNMVSEDHLTGSQSRGDHSAPASPSHHIRLSSSSGYELDFTQQHTRKYASIFTSPAHALRNMPASTSSLREEAQAMSTHQSNLTAAEPSSVPRQHPSSSHSAGFGSPVPFYSRMKDNTGAESGSALGSQNPPRQPELQHPVKDTKMAAAHGLVRSATVGELPRVAQLTIFYAGMVNVYDHVPYEKAQAIMLLAGRESYPNYESLLGGCSATESPWICSPGAINLQASRGGSPAPLSSADLPPPGVVPMAIRPTPTTTAVELPQARKASLARFLERRRDRVRTGPYVPRNEEARRIRENPPSPSVSSARPPTRPSSPVPGHNNTAPPNAGGATTSTSQVNAPPPTPSRESSSEVLDPSPGRPQGENGEGMQPAPPGVSSVGEGSVAMS